MQENVVYILGAGFSAPLGLPVMSNFISRSKDLFADDPEKYREFESVFGRLDAMAKVKNYFRADLSNIEEVLSILEMDSSLSGTRTRSAFLTYISGVISGLTPALEGGGPNSGNWHDFLFGNSKWEPYGRFAGSLLSAGVIGDVHRQRFRFTREQLATQYHVISLNYDLVLENILTFIRQKYECDNAVAFRRPGRIGAVDLGAGPLLCKLHGCVSSGVIVPPTWNKALRKEILPEWRAAHRALSEANHVRVLGYSLPDGDAYFRYLLKAGVLRSKHLKSFDVLCLDDVQSGTSARYRAFVDFPGFRFLNGRTEDYLRELKLAEPRGQGTEKLAVFNTLERAHRKVFDA